MRRSNSDTPKRPGWPATGCGPQAIIETRGDVARDQDVDRSESPERIVSQHLMTKGDVT